MSNWDPQNVKKYFSQKREIALFWSELVEFNGQIQGICVKMLLARKFFRFFEKKVVKKHPKKPFFGKTPFAQGHKSVIQWSKI